MIQEEFNLNLRIYNITNTSLNQYNRNDQKRNYLTGFIFLFPYIKKLFNHLSMPGHNGTTVTLNQGQQSPSLQIAMYIHKMEF